MIDDESLTQVAPDRFSCLPSVSKELRVRLKESILSSYSDLFPQECYAEFQYDPAAAGVIPYWEFIEGNDIYTNNKANAIKFRVMRSGIDEKVDSFLDLLVRL